jgi:hypothetical protein
MNLLRAVAAVVLALAGQAALGRIWPEGHRYADLMLAAVVWYGIAHTQRGAMLIGAAGGLLQDTWFHLGAFGAEGFKKTLIGWLLGVVSVRVDLNHAAGRLVAGAVCAAVDAVADLLVPRLLDQRAEWPGSGVLAVRVVTTGLLVAIIGGIVDRRRGRRAAFRE